MIFTNRGDIDAASSVEAATLTSLAVSQGASHRVSNHYKTDAVRVALLAVFHHKCAYCESLIGVDAPWDVEHYRPKGAVAERPDHPGYYWLSSPGRLFCQRANTAIGVSLTGRLRNFPESGPAGGKLDQFPIRFEADRAMDPDDQLDLEVPLLIDPTIDDPTNHLTFSVDGRVVARDDRGTATTTTCHLDRHPLQTTRRRLATRLLAAVEHGRSCRPLAEVLQHVREVFGAADVPYAEVARALCDSPIAFGVADLNPVPDRVDT